MIKEKKVKVLVIGDIILDRYINTNVERVSPEAPVLVAKKLDTFDKLGGAANVANNLHKYGVNVLLLGIVGKDENANILKKLLKENHIKHLLIRSDSSHTITKTRINSSKKQILRIDEDNGYEYEKEIYKKFFENFKNYDSILISDYQKGTLRDVKKIIKLANKFNKKIYIDPKNSDFSIYKYSYLVKPNLSEFNKACETLGLKGNFHQKTKLLLQKLSIKNLVVTLGNQGIYYVNNKESFLIKALNTNEVFDVTGAGDTVISTIVAFHQKGFDMKSSIEKSNLAASIVIKKIGTSFCTIDELEEETSDQSKVINENKLLNKINEFKNQNKKIVITNGCFDILHPGHCDYLKKSKSYGDILIVLLNSDESVKMNKGANRPINNFEYRSHVLSSLSDVDYILKFNEKTPLRLIKKFMPHTLTKGSDYKINDIVGAKEVIKNNGSVKTIKLLKNYSSSKIINKIKS